MNVKSPVVFTTTGHLIFSLQQSGLPGIPGDRSRCCLWNGFDFLPVRRTCLRLPYLFVRLPNSLMLEEHPRLILLVENGLLRLGAAAVKRAKSAECEEQSQDPDEPRQVHCLVPPLDRFGEVLAAIAALDQ
jgi:hypothetical protein